MAIPVLYISYDGMTDPLGQSQVIPYLIGLTHKGYSITLLSCEKPEAFEKNKSRISELLKANGINWQPIPYTKKPPVLSTVYDVFQLKKKALELHTTSNFSAVHCRSYIAALVGLQLKEKYGVKFIFDMRGLWADERVDGKLWNLSNPLYKSVYRYFKNKEKQFLENADYTISLTENAKQEIHQWSHIRNNPVKIAVIPCCADLDLFNKQQLDIAQKSRLAQELNIQPDDYVLLYLGSIGTWYMLEEMMEFFSVLKAQRKQAKFLFVTKDEHERILQTAEKFGVANDIILRPGNRDEIPALIALSHFSVFFILPSYSKKASSPTKQGEIMAMGVPVVCNTHVGDTDYIVEKYQSGILVRSFNPEAYQDAVQQMMSARFDEQQIIAGAQEYFALQNGVQKYAEVYAEILRH